MCTIRTLIKTVNYQYGYSTFIEASLLKVKSPNFYQVSHEMMQRFLLCGKSLLDFA